MSLKNIMIDIDFSDMEPTCVNGTVIDTTAGNCSAPLYDDVDCSKNWIYDDYNNSEKSCV